MKQFTIILVIVIELMLIHSCTNIEKNTEKSSSYYDNDGTLLVNNKREFIIGTYHLPKSETPFKDAAEFGYNYVCVKPKIDQLDKAAKYGLHTWINIGSVSEKSSSEEILAFEKKINDFKNHPALLNWELEDEPAYTWNKAIPRISSEQLIYSYNKLRKLDKKHAVYLNHAPVNLYTTLQKYNESANILATDVYPIIPRGITPSYAILPNGRHCDRNNSYLSQVGEYIDRLHRVDKNKTRFIILQGFAWELLKKEDERNPEMIFFPSLYEMRFMAFNSIVHGANGVLIWGTGYTPAKSPYLDDLKSVIKELNNYQPILSSKTIKKEYKIEYHELGFSLDKGIEWIVKKYDGIDYLFCVNSDHHIHKISISGLQQNLQKIEVLKENRKVEVKNGKFTDFFEPFAVHIYKINPKNN